MADSNPFVKVESGNMIRLDEQEVSLVDLCVYAGLKSFKNNETNLCCPSYSAVSKRTKVAVSTVSKGIKHLLAAKWIKVTPSDDTKRSISYYKFLADDTKNWEKVPIKLLESKELTAADKGFVIACLRLIYTKNDPKLNIYTIFTNYTNLKISKELGFKYRTVCTRINALTSKGYIELVTDSDPSGNTEQKKMIRLDVLEIHLKDTDNRLKAVEKEIKDLGPQVSDNKNNIAKLEEELRLLKNQLSATNKYGAIRGIGRF